MAGYEAFKPQILSKQLMLERERTSVFKSLCYKGPILGDITKMGDKLFIAGVGRPTVRTYTPGSDITLEEKQAYRQELVIDQFDYVNVMLDQVDDIQAIGSIMESEIKNAKESLSHNIDVFIAKMYSQAGNVIEDAACTSKTIISKLADVQQALFEADVNPDEDIHLVVSPSVYTKMLIAKLIFKTDNTADFGKGFKGNYLNFTVHMSNSIQKTGDVNHCMAFTGQAIAYAEQLPASAIKIYEPDARFGKAFKVLQLYGGTVIRPAELVGFDVTVAAES